MSSAPATDLVAACEVIADMLRHGAHEGPCDGGEYGPCEQHIAAGRARDARAREFLRRCGLMEEVQ